LDAISGLGEKRKTALLKKFETIEGIKAADVEDLTKVPGMNRVVAERVLLQLREMDEEE
jgi:excinuclease ABC subunit C